MCIVVCKGRVEASKFLLIYFETLHSSSLMLGGMGEGLVEGEEEREERDMTT